MATAKKAEDKAPEAPAQTLAGSPEAAEIQAALVRPIVGAGDPGVQSAEELAARFDGVAPANHVPHKFPTKQ
jgi:hypothetical protein